MGIVQLVVLILVVGVIMHLINTYGAAYVSAPFLRLANVIAIVGCALMALFWLLAFLRVPLSSLWQFPAH